MGRAFILESADSSVTFEIIGTVGFQKLGGGLGSVGDVDGDGVEDFGVSSEIFPAADFPQLQVFSGRDRRMLFERNHSALGMASIGDLNGDGKDEFLLGDAVYGIVSLLHGGTFDVVREWHTMRGPLGQSLVVLGEIDGDGHPDFAAGAPGGSIPFGTWPGRVEVFSSDDPAGFLEFTGEGVTEQFGRSLAVPGDLNGDGFPDLVIAGPGCCSTISEFQGPGRLYFFDVRNNVLLRTVDPAHGDSGLGLEMDEAGDVDGNGIGDVVAFVDLPQVLRCDVIEGSTGARILRIPGSTGMAGGGIDWNDDTIPDFAVLHPGGLSREVRVYSGAPPGVRILGTRCGAEPEPRIGCTGSARLGGELPVHLSRVAPGRLAALVLGPPEKRALLDACRPRLAARQMLWMRTTAVSPGAGAATARLCVPNDASLQGRRFHAQWIVPTTASHVGALTRVLEVEILAP